VLVNPADLAALSEFALKRLNFFTIFLNQVLLSEYLISSIEICCVGKSS
jgi:hypothetical protein